MRRQGMPEEEIPEELQVKNMRYKLSKDKKLPVVPVESLDDLRKFLDQTPEGTKVLQEHVAKRGEDSHSIG
eukprot:Skav204632  [mRNA]  locus=scaffold1712:349099:349311:+ [translate_table: standard]